MDKLFNQQKAICESVNSHFSPVADNDTIGIAIETFIEFKQPINGLRHPLEGGTAGWYLWAGELSVKTDFFKPLHVKHLTDINSLILNYLALAPGWRFLIDDKGYEDIWFDESLLKFFRFLNQI